MAASVLPDPQDVDPPRLEFPAVCEELSPALYAWARLRLRALGAPAIQPDDVVQETWVRALTLTQSGAAVAAQSLRAWIFGIAQNVLYEQARALTRSERAAPNRADASVSKILDRIEDTVTSLCTQLSRDETIERFLALAEHLDEVDRALLVRCGFEGVSATDAARRLDLEPATAIKRWQRLRERLRATDLARKLGLSTD
jgi:RNA polymerase sigma factor (sigma-70 family)